MKRRAAIAILTTLFTSLALAGDYSENVIGVIKTDIGTMELLSDSCAESGAVMAARAGSQWADKVQWFRQQTGRVLFVAATKDHPVLLVCYEKTAGGIRTYGPGSAERVEYADSGIQWFRKPAQSAESAQTVVEPPSIHEITSATDDVYRYGVVEATCADMARFFAAMSKPDDSASHKVFVAWLAQQPGNFVDVERLSDGKDTGERGCFVRTDSGYRITIHGRVKPVEYDRSR